MTSCSARDPQPAVLTETELGVVSREVKALIPSNADTLSEQQAKLKYIDLVRLLIATCQYEHLTTTHQVAAWNALSTLLDQTASRDSTAVRSLLWSTELWQGALQIFLHHSHYARPKSIKQLLVSLTSTLQKTKNDHDAEQYTQDTVHLLASSILSRDVRRPVRPCMLLLSSLLRKGVTELATVASLTGFETTEDGVDVLLQECMELATTGDGVSAAGQLLTTLLDKADQSTNRQPSLWVTTLSGLLVRRPDRTQAFRQHLMPALFERDHQGYKSLALEVGFASFIDCQLSNPSRADLLPLLAVLQGGRDCNLTRLGAAELDDGQTGLLTIPVAAVAALLSHGDRDIRLAGLSLLIQSHSSSEPFDNSILAALRASLPHLHADTDLNFRSELISHTQRLFERLRSSSAATNRSQPSNNVARDAEAFVTWYQRFILKELRPSASYQRHISALRCLVTLASSGIDPSIPSDILSKATKGGGKWPFQAEIINEDLEEVLIATLLDPFDDVRSGTSALLNMHFKDSLHKERQHKRVTDSLKVVERMMLASGRADHADAVAHLHTLLFMSAPSSIDGQQSFIELIKKSESMVTTGEQDLPCAVRAYPLHGILISLRYLLDKTTLQDLLDSTEIERLAVLLQRIWTLVRPVLIDDAPEGHLPSGIRDSNQVSSKAVLSYCWRALREASQLIDSVLMLRMLNNSSTWTQALKKQMIDLTFTQLAELRHRGAFSTVAQTWSQCCQQASSIVPLSELFGSALSLIRGTTINTRRSAGMPSIVCGILIADDTGDLLRNAFVQLESVARSPVLPGQDDESSLPQVHAMNCLKDIVKNTRLAEASAAFVPTALQLAADTLPSRTWAIRNCGLMLFRACLDRLLGTNDSYEDDTAVYNVLDFRQHKTLLDQVLTLLPHHGKATIREGVFPALQLLQHSELPGEQVQRVCDAVYALLRDRSWHIRDKAARTLVAIMPTDALIKELFSGLASQEQGTIQHNTLHGLLLCVKHLCQRAPVNDTSHVASHLRAQLSALQSQAHLTTAKSQCSTIYAMTAPTTASSMIAPSVTSMSAAQALREVDSAAAADAWLLSRAVLLEQKASSSHALSTQLLDDIKDWLTICSLSVTGDSMFSAETLARSLQCLQMVYVKLDADGHSRPELLRLAVLIYDLLQDDDEDVRIVAAHAAVRLLAIRGGQVAAARPLEPLVASQKLVSFMVTYGQASPALAEECLKRTIALDAHTTKPVFDPADDDHQQIELFAEEKQNLYIDEVFEARVWSQAALKLKASAFQQEQVDRLVVVVDTGLDQLLSKTTSSPHTVLNWSTNIDAFVFGLKVVYGAEMLLYLIEQGVKLSVKPSALREKLLRLNQAAQAARLHPIWRSEFERVSKKAAVSGFSAIQSLLNGVVGKLDSATTLS